MRIVFLGTPEIARTCLAEILKTNHEVVAVVTKPDKEVGRGKKITFSPVKELALKNNIPVYQFKSLSKEGVEILKNLKPDVLVLVAFGQILSQEILDIALPINYMVHCFQNIVDLHQYKRLFLTAKLRVVLLL